MPESAEQNEAYKVFTLGDWVVDILRKSEGWQRLSETVNTALKKFSEGLYKFAQALQTAFEQYRIAEAEAVQVLKKYKWILSPSMPRTFVLEIIRMGLQEGYHHSKINALFVEFYSKNNFQELSRLIERWSYRPLFKKRMKIFRDCVATMRYAEGRFNPSNVVIPTLLAQIDGILTEYCNIKGFNRYGKGSKAWKEKFKEEIKREKFSSLFNSLLVDLLFQDSYSGERLLIPTTFSRHKVVHGENTRYGRIDNTIRAFLILDFLSQLSVNKVNLLPHQMQTTPLE